LPLITLLRLNAKHLDLQCADVTRCEWPFRQPTRGRHPLPFDLRRYANTRSCLARPL
jgi:hypothetical protein